MSWDLTANTPPEPGDTSSAFDVCAGDEQQMGPVLEARQRLRLICSQLPSSNPTARIAEAVLRGEPLDESAFRLLVDRIEAPICKSLISGEVINWMLGRTSTSPEHTEREAAVWALARAPLTYERRKRAAAAIVEPLLNRGPAGKRIERANLLRAVALYPLGLASVFMIGIVASFSGPGGIIAPFAFLVLILGCMLAPIAMPVLIASSLQRNRKHLEAVRHAAAMALRYLRIPESIGALSEVTHTKSPLSKDALTSLKDLLPTLTPDHYGRLGSDAVPNLCGILMLPVTRDDWFADSRLMGVQESTKIAVLTALGRIGDGRALPVVQAVAERGASLALREAAAKIVPVLDERKQRETAYATLLRGASPASPPQQEILLRPAEAGSETAPDQLLRPL